MLSLPVQYVDFLSTLFSVPVASRSRADLAQFLQSNLAFHAEGREVHRPDCSEQERRFRCLRVSSIDCQPAFSFATLSLLQPSVLNSISENFWGCFLLVSLLTVTYVLAFSVLSSQLPHIHLLFIFPCFHYMSLLSSVIVSSNILFLCGF